MLVTSAVHHIVDADQVLYLDRGRIVQRGRPDDLLAVDGPVRQLFETFRRAATEPVAAEPSRAPTPLKRREASTPVEDAGDVEARRASVPGNTAWECFKARCARTNDAAAQHTATGL